MGSKLIKISGLEIKATYYAPPPPPPPPVPVPVIAVPRYYIPSRTKSSYQQWLMGIDGSRSVSSSQAGSVGSGILGTVSGAPMSVGAMSTYFSQSVTNLISQGYSGSNEIDIVVGGGYGNAWANRILSEGLQEGLDTPREDVNDDKAVEAQEVTAPPTLATELQKEVEYTAPDQVSYLELQKRLSNGWISAGNGQISLVPRPLPGEMYDTIISSVQFALSRYGSFPDTPVVASNITEDICQLAAYCFPHEPMINLGYTHTTDYKNPPEHGGYEWRSTHAEGCPTINIIQDNGQSKLGRCKAFVFAKMLTVKDSIYNIVSYQTFNLIYGNILMPGCTLEIPRADVEGIVNDICFYFDNINRLFTDWFSENSGYYKEYDTEIAGLYNPDRYIVRACHPSYFTLDSYVGSAADRKDVSSYENTGLTNCATYDLDLRMPMWDDFGLINKSLLEFDLTQFPTMISKFRNFSVPEVAEYYR